MGYLMMRVDLQTRRTNAASYERAKDINCPTWKKNSDTCCYDANCENKIVSIGPNVNHMYF